MSIRCLVACAAAVAAIGCFALAPAGCAEDGDQNAGGSSSGGTQPHGGGGTGPGGGGADGGGGSGGSGGFTVQECQGAPTATPGDDVCAVVPGSGSLLVVGDVLAPYAVYRQGGVLIDAAGEITCVGCDCAAEAGSATKVVCPDAVVSPGLVNAHDHLGWMSSEPWDAAAHGADPALRYEHRHDWRKGKGGQPIIDPKGGASKEQKTLGELRFVLGGGTAIFGSGDAGGLLRDLDATGSADNGLGQPGAVYETFPLGDSDGTQQAQGCDQFSVKPWPEGDADCYAPHVAEGIDAYARNELSCLTGKGTGSADVLDGRSAIIHGVGLGASEVGELADKGIRLVWSPRSNIALYGDTAPVTLYDRMGVTIGLGTDWIPSGSMNMLRELACAASFNELSLGGYFSDHALWLMATLGAAGALAFDDATGVLATGHAGDVAVFRKGTRVDHAAVVHAGVADVALVLRGGEVLGGNAAVVAALEDDCDSLDVCGIAKRVCLLRDTGQTLAALQSAASLPYPLFFCEAPDKEPSCLPARTLASDSVNGSTLYAGVSSVDDADGDGIGDGEDDCPGVFNPARPVDGAKQADADGDGLGDACDPCPLEVGEGCSPVTAGDVDDDDVPSYLDNCPLDANPDQADGDHDGKGDVCDPCPADPNPGATKCPGKLTTIFAIQDVTHPDHPAEGTRVKVPCVVTAVAPKHAWCQDPAGGKYSGISIFVGTAPTYADSSPVVLGDSVTVEGDYTEYYELSQLEKPIFTFVAKATVPAPVVVLPASIANGGNDAEAYEGVLVKVLDVTVVKTNPDDPKDYDETELTAGLRLDDLAIDGGVSGGQLDNQFPVGTAFASITGVHHYSFSAYKLLPRMASDIVKK